MKKNCSKHSRSLIKLYLLKNQIYKNYIRNLNEPCLDNFMLELKQAFKIIYLYSIKKKKILFIGFPFNKTLHNKTKHIFISKIFYNKNKLNLNNFDLIVVNKTSKKDDDIIAKTIKETKTLIVFGDIINKHYKKSYHVFKLSKKKIKTFCIFAIFSILFRAEKI